MNEIATFKSEEEARSCYGKYIVTKSFRDTRVIRDEKEKPIADKDPSLVLKKTKEMGYENPVIFFLQDPNIRQIF